MDCEADFVEPPVLVKGTVCEVFERLILEDEDHPMSAGSDKETYSSVEGLDSTQLVFELV